MSRYLAEMTTAEAADAVQAQAVVVIPIGACEQHGPAMPMGTDTIRADALAARVADEIPDQVVVGPTVPVGVSPHHLGFAGTVSLTPRTMLALLREYVDSLAGHGWRRILVITGHGGNNATLGALAQELLGECPDIEFAWTPVTSIAAKAVAEMDVSQVHGHCGEAETAQMLHVAPELVRTERLAAGVTTADQFDDLSRLARSVSHPALAVRYDQLTPSGVLGDPRRATAAAGRAIYDEATQRIVSFISDWRRT